MRTETATWIGGVPGFCEGLPDVPANPDYRGGYIFNIPGAGVRWQGGMRPLPGANTSASYCRLAPDGIGIICQGQDDDQAWRWEGSAWAKLGLPAFGPNACIFDNLGLPHVISHAPAVGYRYAQSDGTLVTCEATYADPVRGLYEYTEWDDLGIGQGGKPENQGAIVRFAGETFNRRIATGTIRNVRVRRAGDQFAIGFCNFDTRTATILWCSLAELRAMPPVVVTTEPPTIPPIEPPIIPPTIPPTKPPIPPIEPPKPAPYHKHKGVSMSLDGQTVVRRGPGGKLGRPDAPNTGPWGDLGTGWRGVIWDGTDASDPRYHHLATAVEGQNYLLTSVQHAGLAGADATKYSGSINAQFYYKPDGNTDAGGYETWRVYDGNENGGIQAQIEYTDPAPFFSCSVALEVVG